MKETRAIIRCDKCGREEQHKGNHAVPDGWFQIETLQSQWAWKRWSDAVDQLKEEGVKEFPMIPSGAVTLHICDQHEIWNSLIP